MVVKQNDGDLRREKGLRVVSFHMVVKQWGRADAIIVSLRVV